MKRLMMTAVLQLMLCTAFAKDTGRAMIRGVIEGCEGDTVTLLVNDEMLSGRYYIDGQLYTTTIKNNRFAFDVVLPADFSYVTLGFVKKQLAKKNLAGYYLGPGEEIMITYQKDTVLFGGKAAGRWKCMYVLRQHEWLGWSKEEGRLLPKLNLYESFVLTGKKRDSLAMVRQQVIAGYKRLLTNADVLRLQADEMAFRYGSLYTSLNYRLAEDKSGGRMLKGVYDSFFRKLPAQPIPAYAAVSDLYTNMVLLRVKFDVIFNDGVKKDGSALFNAVIETIQQRYKGRLQEKLVLQYVLRSYKENDASFAVTKRILPAIKTARYRKLLEDLVLHGSSGTPAPDFTLPDVKDSMIHFSSFKNNVVVVAVWITGCTHCLRLEKAMKGIRSAFAGKEVVFVSVSADQSKHEWKESLRKELYCDSSEVNLYAGEKDNTFIRYYNISSYPSMIIIGRDGKLVSTTPPDPRKENDRSKLIQLIGNAINN